MESTAGAGLVALGLIGLFVVVPVQIPVTPVWAGPYAGLLVVTSGWIKDRIIKL